MLEIGFADDIGTNCILSGKAIAVVDPSLFCYLNIRVVENLDTIKFSILKFTLISRACDFL